MLYALAVLFLVLVACALISGIFTRRGSVMKFKVYKDSSGEWRWRLVAGNGQTIGDSGEGYTSKAHTLEMVGKIKAGAREAEVVVDPEGDDS